MVFDFFWIFPTSTHTHDPASLCWVERESGEHQEWRVGGRPPSSAHQAFPFILPVLNDTHSPEPPESTSSCCPSCLSFPADPLSQAWPGAHRAGNVSPAPRAGARCVTPARVCPPRHLFCAVLVKVMDQSAGLTGGQ